ncbi:hypothetical protein HPB47_015444 [Ixodes persulcatus]|uniref:Uncharacterized protein n=1 Tax=Ixodes persulcatus TaxID=34615 RepID=A0AC60QTG8_IXOPE|nr:hypothetical protein HPB47_015444 [Ixodes persulcatus]
MTGEGASGASKSATSNQGRTTILCAGALRQRDPKIFRGIGDDDIDYWLESVERRLPLSRKPQPPVQLARLSNAAESPSDKWGDLRYLIQEIVSDEVARQLGMPAASPEPYVSPSFRALIQEEVTAAILCPAIPPTMPMSLAPTYAEMVARPPPMPPTYGGPRRIDQFAFRVLWLDMLLGFLTIDQALLVVVEVILSKITLTTNGSNNQADLRPPDDTRCLPSTHQFQRRELQILLHA